jgi:ketosteroid isomerase-like protein
VSIRSNARKYVYALVLLVALGAVLVKGFGWLRAPTTDSRTPEQVVDAFFGGLQAGNAALTLSLLSPDVEVFEMGMIDRSRRDYASNHLPADMSIAAYTQRELVSRRSGGSGDTRWVVSTYRLIENKGGETSTMTMAETALLRQAADSWQIAHLHWSLDATPPPASQGGAQSAAK